MANAFDWFAMMTFSVFAVFVWICWSAMALGWPTKLAQRVVVLRPELARHVDFCGIEHRYRHDCLVDLADRHRPRSPYRSLTHWTMGFTTLWLLLTTLGPALVRLWQELSSGRASHRPGPAGRPWLPG